MKKEIKIALSGLAGLLIPGIEVTGGVPWRSGPGMMESPAFVADTERADTIEEVRQYSLGIPAREGVQGVYGSKAFVGPSHLEEQNEKLLLSYGIYGRENGLHLKRGLVEDPRYV